MLVDISLTIRMRQELPELPPLSLWTLEQIQSFHSLAYIWKAKPCWWKLLAQTTDRARSLALASAGSSIAINNAMMATTTRSSINVNARCAHWFASLSIFPDFITEHVIGGHLASSGIALPYDG